MRSLEINSLKQYGLPSLPLTGVTQICLRKSVLFGYFCIYIAYHLSNGHRRFVPHFTESWFMCQLTLCGSLKWRLVLKVNYIVTQPGKCGRQLSAVHILKYCFNNCFFPFLKSVVEYCHYGILGRNTNFLEEKQTCRTWGLEMGHLLSIFSITHKLGSGFKQFLRHWDEWKKEVSW